MSHNITHSADTEAFSAWIDTFLDEKDIDTTTVFTVRGPQWGDNVIPLGVVVEHMKLADSAEQKAIKDTLVRIDYGNGDVVDYLRHLASALAR